MADGELTSFIADFNQFKGRMDEFKSTAERRFVEVNSRLSTIEKDVGTVCMDHEAVATMFAHVKEEALRQDKINIDQTTRNTDTNNWQNRQDTSIQGLQNQDRFLEYKISNRDLAKLVSAIGVVLIPSVTLIVFILDKWFS